MYYCKLATSFLMTALNAAFDFPVAIDASPNTESPSSPALPIPVSIGTFPRKGIPFSLHMCSAPPLGAANTGQSIVKRLESIPFASNASLTNAVTSSVPSSKLNVTSPNLKSDPLIFSTTPKTFTPVFSQKFTSFLTSAMATSCGVVTIRAPSIFAPPFKYCTMLKCSSLVPGGASTGKVKWDNPAYPEAELPICLLYTSDAADE